MKTTKSVSQGNQAQSRDSNPGFPEYDVGIVTSSQRGSVTHFPLLSSSASWATEARTRFLEA